MYTLSAFLVIPSIFGVISLLLFFYYFHNQSLLQKSEKWIPVEGTITKSLADERTSMDSEGNSSSSYLPEIEYSYKLLGQDYLGKRIAFGSIQGGDLAKVNKILNRYPVGSHVTVYCDPNNPEECVLERSLPNTSLILGILFMFAAVISFFMKWL
jgi:hypothetical protein